MVLVLWLWECRCRVFYFFVHNGAMKFNLGLCQQTQTTKVAVVVVGYMGPSIIPNFFYVRVSGSISAGCDCDADADFTKHKILDFYF
jgi:hypothetical protein